MCLHWYLGITDLRSLILKQHYVFPVFRHFLAKLREFLSHRSCHAKQTLHDAFTQTSQSVAVSQNVIYVMQTRRKKATAYFIREDHEQGQKGEVMNERTPPSVMATAVTEEIQGSDDRRYVTDSHVCFPCEIKLIFYSQLTKCLFIVSVSIHHRWKGPDGVKESAHGDQLQRVYWKLQKQKFCNVSSVFPYVHSILMFNAFVTQTQWQCRFQKYVMLPVGRFSL